MSSREKALQKVRDALNQIGNEKQKLKQKRKQRDNKFREQKVKTSLKKYINSLSVTDVTL